MRRSLCFLAAAALAAPAPAWAAPPEGGATSAAPPDRSAAPSAGGALASSAPSAGGALASSAAAAPFAGAAGAEAEAPAGPEGKPAPGFGLDLRAGLRAGWVTGPGFDPFGETNVLSQASFGASYAFARSGPLTVHAGAFYDVGAAAATEARGSSSRLGVHRAALGLEGRYELGARLRPYARVAPGALRLDARVDDAGGGSLESGQWTWSLDATAGAAFSFASFGRGAPAKSFLVFAEGGYGFAGSVSMAMRPEGGGEGARVGEVYLPPLRLSGALFRVGAGFAF
ncbi:MAG TPA: hypothetical protein VFS43_18250 [Polyangiaceae bacterium]|nr:hypothetical protein [Polyangiaceae bacterium]